MDVVGTERHELCLGEALTLGQAETIAESLFNALSKNSVVTIDVSGAVEADISFVQLVLAARRWCAGREKRIELSSPASGLLLDVLIRGGVLQPEGEHMGADEAFWTGKTSEA